MIHAVRVFEFSSPSGRARGRDNLHFINRLMLSQTSLTNKLKEHLIISTTMEVITFNPTTLYRATIIRFGGHIRISPTEVQIFKVKEAQVIIIKKKSFNLLMKINFMPY